VYAGTRRPLDHSDGRVTPLTLDVTSAAQIRAAVERVESLDVLVNNAGLGLYDDFGDPAALEQHLAVNLFGTYAVTRGFLPLLTRSRGAIVNVLSVAAIASLPIMPNYRSRRRPSSRSRKHSERFWPAGASRYMPSRPARWTRI
jgi:NAD(P)-dependent dehydrogenase (short-subunit alcohol dehydrogenase family)